MSPADGDGEHARLGSSAPLLVEGALVAPPLTAGQARLLAGAGLLASEAEGILRSWEALHHTWVATVTGRVIPAGVADERVGDGWSVTQSLRHLIFVADAWVARGVTGSTRNHPLGLPPHFLLDAADDLGLDLGAAPPVEEVLEVWEGRSRAVAGTVAAVGADLDRACHPPLDAFTVRGALQVVVFEQWAHHQYVERDLGVLLG